MSDWQVGDLAVCVDDRDCRKLANGRVYGVVEVIPPGSVSSDGVPNSTGITGLRLAGVQNRPHCAWSEYRFRKVRPDKHEACEDEFVTLLKRGKVSA